MDQRKSRQMELVKALDDFLVLQREQSALLAARKLKGLSGWHDKRERVFLHLKQSLERLPKLSDRDSRDFAGLVREKLEQVIMGEERLAAEIRSQKDAIGEQLKNIRKGKNVLKGYSMKNGSAPGPTCLSSRT